MTYGKDARIGNITVFSRSGAERVYKLFCKAFAREMTMEASIVLDQATEDMIELGFTPEECEELEISVY